ncbi:MAG: PfkB family carbohydrate kinase [Pseudorhizobium sp.]
MKKLRFASVGDNCIDRFRAPVAQSLVGGNAVNVAVQLARLGHNSFYFGAVGPDPDGVRTRSLLAENGVKVDHVQVRKGKTAFTDIEVLQSGERVLVFEDFGVCVGYRPTPLEVDVLKTMDHVHLGWIDDNGTLRQILSRAGISVSQDISVNTGAANVGVDGLSIAFGSAGPDNAALERMILDFRSGGAALAVVTRGERGSVAVSVSDRASTGVVPVDVVDTTGAGDSFIAGFLSARLQGSALEPCLVAGRDLAAKTCQHVGGFPQQPMALDEEFDSRFAQ